MLKKFSKNKFLNNRFNQYKYNITSKASYYCITDFSDGLISKKIPQLHFTNYAKSENEDGFNIVLDYYIRYLNGDYSFIDDFTFDEDGIDGGYRAERLLKIIKELRNIKYKQSDYPFILKMNHKINDTLRFFWSHHNNNLRLIFIDLYHLGIYGNRYIDKKSKPISIERLYKSKSNNDIPLEKIKII